MADRPRVASHGTKKPQSCGAQRLPPTTSSRNRPATAPTTKSTHMDLLSKELEYKRLNAELEAKTAELVRQAEEVIREQNEVLSKPISTHPSLDITNNSEETGDAPVSSLKKFTAKAATEKNSFKAGRPNRLSSAPGNTAQKKKATVIDDIAVPEDFADFSLAEIISKMENRLDDDVADDQLEDEVMPSAGEEMGAEVQIRLLRAKLGVMQEEINQLSEEHHKKDEENRVLCGKLKQMEEDRVKLQRTTNVQQTQLEKQRALADDANRNCDGLRQHVVMLQKEVEEMKRALKQASSTHSAVEVRLNRALEEVERSKAEINKLKQSRKDSANQEQQRIDALQAENKKLEKQKTELVSGFKKQLKLIDVLKRQKMHFEAAKMMSFTEEEFMKALDWSKS